MPSRLRIAFEPKIHRLFHQWWRISRGMTLGMRAMVLDDFGRVFLVRHGYVAGWHLPGGGVETGETIFEALTRELREEGNIEMRGSPVLFGVYFNNHVSPRDHVLLYVVRDFVQAEFTPNREIVETGFFAIDALPEGTTLGTRARIAEVVNGRPPGLYWRPMDAP